MVGQWRLRAYRADADRSIVESLWHAALAPTWPLLPRGIDKLPAGLVASSGDTPVGFIATDPAGSIPLLLVHPAHQRRGCGTALVEAALDQLRAGGATEVRAGSGGEAYIWPGAPLDLPAAVAFFTRSGWLSVHDCLDLTQDLRDYVPPAGVDEAGVRPAGVTMSVAAESDLADVGTFEASTFPQWARWFDGQSGEILIARDATGAIVATLLFDARDPGPLAPMLGSDAGTIGCVGVAPERHGDGIGTALVARASQLLHEAGTRECFIGWAVREQFYGRVGYRPWRRYRMFHRPL